MFPDFSSEFQKNPLLAEALLLKYGVCYLSYLVQTIILCCFQVTTLVNTSNKGPSNKKRGRSKKAHVLAASVEQATENFLEKGDKIAKESQFLKEELVAAVEDVRKQGIPLMKLQLLRLSTFVNYRSSQELQI